MDQRQETPSDVELIKERFAKLLLGQDMSGTGKGVSSALALSSAITNLAASVFGEQSRLEPMPPERKARWTREIDWLLSVTDHIVEFVPSQQGNMEIMVTKQRKDLRMNIPALRQLDAILVACFDNFQGQNAFAYLSNDASDAEKGRKDDKWWLPTPKVPPNGLSNVTRKWLQFQKDSANQVLKASMFINAQVLSEMEIPDNYIESLPKNGRASLGDSIYKSITVEHFDPIVFLSTLDLSSEHKILDIKNKIEASIVIWKRKMSNKEQKSILGSLVSQEKRELFEERAETILLLLKLQFPGLPQSALDISKIQYNKDVGHAVLESYSRILEGLAFAVISKIEDVFHADSLARNSTADKKEEWCLVSPTKGNDQNPACGPISMTLSDFIGWSVDQGDTEQKKDQTDETSDLSKHMNKVSYFSTTPKKASYISKLENLGAMRSPTERH